jgi:hypothetical protein
MLDLGLLQSRYAHDLTKMAFLGMARVTSRWKTGGRLRLKGVFAIAMAQRVPSLQPSDSYLRRRASLEARFLTHALMRNSLYLSHCTEH